MFKIWWLKNWENVRVETIRAKMVYQDDYYSIGCAYVFRAGMSVTKMHARDENNCVPCGGWKVTIICGFINDHCAEETQYIINTNTHVHTSRTRGLNLHVHVLCVSRGWSRSGENLADKAEDFPANYWQTNWMPVPRLGSSLSRPHFVPPSSSQSSHSYSCGGNSPPPADITLLARVRATHNRLLFFLQFIVLVSTLTFGFFSFLPISSLEQRNSDADLKAHFLYRNPCPATQIERIPLNW